MSPGYNLKSNFAAYVTIYLQIHIDWLSNELFRIIY